MLNYTIITYIYIINGICIYIIVLMTTREENKIFCILVLIVGMERLLMIITTDSDNSSHLFPSKLLHITR